MGRSHRWYSPYKRRYGPKPNTRRARGLKRRDYGKKKLLRTFHTYDNLPSVGIETDVEIVQIPRSIKKLKEYIGMYNFYVNKYQLYRDKKVCIELTMKKFDIKQKRTVLRAIKVCKYILATANEE
jgi:hypothetical protein